MWHQISVGCSYPGAEHLNKTNKNETIQRGLFQLFHLFLTWLWEHRDHTSQWLSLLQLVLVRPKSQVLSGN